MDKIGIITHLLTSGHKNAGDFWILRNYVIEDLFHQEEATQINIIKYFDEQLREKELQVRPISGELSQCHSGSPYEEKLLGADSPW